MDNSRKTAISRRILLAAAAAIILLAAGRMLIWGEIRAFLHRNYTEVRVVDGSNWFDYPVGKPNARGYYRAQKFGGANLHLGEDWNGCGGGNSDYGDPVYAIADGTVSFAEDVGLGWGNTVRIIYSVRDGKTVEAVYAHLSEMYVKTGDQVSRGHMIGRIGDAGGAHPAHLHFEIRTKTGLPLGGGYGRNENGYFCDPTDFIDRHRKRP